ncbi:MAG TPA: TPM domain-containing protein [Methylomirabilota bacterium]|nr:TPM domain-containing protein [Methylomirabilota bacterium]
MARHPRWVRKFLTEADLEAVARAVGEAERWTSAEMRVHLDLHCRGSAFDRAVEVFQRLGMHRAAERHGVLIYVAIQDRKLAVIGDWGIHERVGQEYWERLVAAVAAHLGEERPRDGLIHAVGALGAALARHFPRQPDDRNELSDEVSLA